MNELTYDPDIWQTTLEGMSVDLFRALEKSYNWFVSICTILWTFWIAPRNHAEISKLETSYEMNDLLKGLGASVYPVFY